MGRQSHRRQEHFFATVKATPDFLRHIRHKVFCFGSAKQETLYALRILSEMSGYGIKQICIAPQLLRRLRKTIRTLLQIHGQVSAATLLCSSALFKYAWCLYFEHGTPTPHQHRGLVSDFLGYGFPTPKRIIQLHGYPAFPQALQRHGQVLEVRQNVHHHRITHCARGLRPVPLQLLHKELAVFLHVFWRQAGCVHLDNRSATAGCATTSNEALNASFVQLPALCGDAFCGNNFIKNLK
mmetsp:Transcript_35748/g.83719  ORF Transcript_35748/g.83719 Transcript_35748/m.83719 type:complete len:239 (+) Transcript_35748:96-812(+)